MNCFIIPENPGNYVILKISLNPRVNNCAYSLDMYQRLATLLKEIPAQLFCCDDCKFFRNTFFTEHLRGAASVIQNKEFLLQPRMLESLAL